MLCRSTRAWSVGRPATAAYSREPGSWPAAARTPRTRAAARAAAPHRLGGGKDVSSRAGRGARREGLCPTPEATRRPPKQIICGEDRVAVRPYRGGRSRMEGWPGAQGATTRRGWPSAHDGGQPQLLGPAPGRGWPSAHHERPREGRRAKSRSDDASQAGGAAGWLRRSFREGWPFAHDGGQPRTLGDVPMQGGRSRTMAITWGVAVCARLSRGWLFAHGRVAVCARWAQERRFRPRGSEHCGDGRLGRSAAFSDSLRQAWVD